MNYTEALAALALPGDSLVDKRVPKKLLLEQGAPTPGDKRAIQDGIEELAWIAALKPTNIGVPIYRDVTREYLEIAVLTGTFRQAAKATRLIELVHRAIPYPVVLLSSHEGSLTMSLAHKRFSQSQSGAVVVEGEIATALLTPRTKFKETFLARITLASQPPETLFSIYQGWIDQIETLAAAHITDRYAPATDAEAAAARRAALASHARNHDELISLRAQAAKEKQMKRRVELNLEIRRLEIGIGKLSEEL